jgi:hypothetical protein
VGGDTGLRHIVSLQVASDLARHKVRISKHGTRQLVNHFENHSVFTTKDQMFRNLFSHCEAKKINTFEYVPLTFLLEVDSLFFAQDYERFVNYFSYIDKQLQA